MKTILSETKSGFGGALVVFARRWRLFIDQKLAESGLTDASWTPLIYLHRLGDGILQKDLAVASGLDDSSLVRLIDILSKRELLSREVDPNDRRARRLYLTKKGHETATAIKAQLAEIEAELLKDFGDEEIASTLSIFERVDARMTENRRDDGRTEA